MLEMTACFLALVVAFIFIVWVVSVVIASAISLEQMRQKTGEPIWDNPERD